MKWGWLFTAVALALYGVVRRRRLGRLTLVALAVAVVAAALIGTEVIHLPNVEKLLEDAGSALGRWTYLLVGAFAFLETGAFIGLIAPGETAVLVGGLVAGQGKIDLIVLIAVVWTCAVAGDLTSYTLGRRLGRAWLLRHGERLKITEERLHQVEGFFERRGGATILVGRFIGLVRALAPFIAGTSKMPLRTFLPYDVLGAGAWAAALCVLGAVFWRSFDKVTQYVSRGLAGFALVVAIVLALYALVRLRRDPEFRERVRAWLREHQDQPFLRPLVRLAGPAWRWVLRPAAGGVDATARFGAGRFSSGPLGLELTTLIALAAVGAFSFAVIARMVEASHLPRIDRWAFDVVDRLRFDALTEVVKIITWLGSSPVTGALALLTALWAFSRRRPREGLALLIGYGLSLLGAHIAKAAFDRPRPPAPLVHTVLSSFPSGHALYAVTLVACATVLVRAGAGWALRVALVTVAIAAVAVVAATRVYLRAHYLTDVLAGVGLGTAIWAVVGAFTVFAGAVRHNERVP